MYRLVTIDELSDINLIQKLEVNGKCPFDEFCAEIMNEGTYTDEIDTIQLYLSKLGQNVDIPAKKFKELRGRRGNDNIKDYELRTRNLRVYCIRGLNRDKIIILAGKKSNQDKDLKRFRKIKLEFMRGN